MEEWKVEHNETNIWKVGVGEQEIVQFLEKYN